MKRARLTEYMKMARPQMAEWKKQNPKEHPCEMYKDVATAIVEWVKEDGCTEAELPKAVYAGGIPEYTYCVAYLAEAGIPTFEEN